MAPADASLLEGTECVVRGDYSSGVSHLSRAISLRPAFPEAYYYRGCAYERQGDTNRAIADYSEAIRLNPRFVEAYKNRMVLYRDNGMMMKGLEDAARVQELTT